MPRDFKLRDVIFALHEHYLEAISFVATLGARFLRVWETVRATAPAQGALLSYTPI